MSDLSSILPEPQDGTMVVLLDEERNPSLTWRNDSEARSWWAKESDERWYTEATWCDGDPMGWDEITSYAVAAYVVTSDATAVVVP